MNPLYLEVRGEQFLALYHPATGSAPSVLICPPLGWDDVCSYRARRDWAEHLASGGHAALRFDLPGTGDSAGSPHDADRLETWTAAVEEAAAWLARHDGTDVVAVGIGAGGLLALRAVANGAPIGDLVLWSVPARGRTIVRELRAFARLEAASLGDQLAAGTDESIVAGGFPLAAATAEAIAAVDLASMSLPRAAERRVLLLERDGLPVDGDLLRALREAGAEVEVGPGEGYGEMMLEPGFARAPVGVFGRVDGWLARGETAGTASATAPPPGTLDAGGVCETPLELAAPAGTVFGVLAEPSGGERASICAVFLNAGAVRRIGPNRMWVTAARRWAARGVPTVRLDVPGIGDGGGASVRFPTVASFYTEDVVADVRAALDGLVAHGLPGRFVLVGLCSGGYWAFQSALADERVVGAFPVNTTVLEWSATLLPDRRLQPLRASLRHAVTSAKPRELMWWTRVVLARLAGRLARARGGDSIDRAFDRLRDAGRRLVLVYEDEDPQRWELERDGRLAQLERWPNVTVEQIAGKDHTLRPPAMQEQAHAALDRALDSVLAAQPPP